MLLQAVRALVVRPELLPQRVHFVRTQIALNGGWAHNHQQEGWLPYE